MVKGEIVLSVADIDLVYLNLGLLLSAVKTVKAAGDSEEAISCSPEGEYTHGQVKMHQGDFSDEPQPETRRKEAAPTPLANASDQGNSDHREAIARAIPAAIDHELGQYLAPKTTIDPKNVEKGLARLVLTLIDLLRKLMEKQAIRRIDAGQLHAEEIERVGDTFLRLDERMEQLKKTFDLKDEDLNLDLGPLGELL